MADRLTILNGDCRQELKGLADESVHCVVTSPPYFGLRDYGVDGQIGLEETPKQYISTMVEVFREVWRVLRNDGTVWLNLGDSYAQDEVRHRQGQGSNNGRFAGKPEQKWSQGTAQTGRKLNHCLKPKDLLLMPHRTAIALQQDGWYLRSDIVWSKPNPMPESVTDRPTRSHEYVFLLTKAPKYFYDAEAIREPFADDRNGNPGTYKRTKSRDKGAIQHRQDYGFLNNGNGWNADGKTTGRNKRSVWVVSSNPYSGAHFATFPPALIEPCILAGTSARGCCVECGAPYERILESSPEYAKLLGKDWCDPEMDQKEGRGHFLLPTGEKAAQRPVKRNAPSVTAEYITVGWKASCGCFHGPGYADTEPCIVLDPFGGSGTSGKVAIELGRKAILIELNETYIPLIEKRCATQIGLAM